MDFVPVHQRMEGFVRSILHVDTIHTPFKVSYSLHLTTKLRLTVT
jgi:hypothetical protein